MLAERGLYGGAVDDLDRAIALDPGRADSYAFRASAHRFLDDLGRAEADAEGALALDGNHPEALLERGIIRRLGGDDEGARSDWIRLLAPGARAAGGRERPRQPATDGRQGAIAVAMRREQGTCRPGQPLLDSTLVMSLVTYPGTDRSSVRDFLTPRIWRTHHGSQDSAVTLTAKYWISTTVMPMV